MSDKSLVSVIIPAYNAEVYIEETVSSVLNQTYTHLELIIVNDGSKDNTLLKLEKLKASDNRIKIINKSNSGVSDSRNTGLNEVKGNFIAFLDADDVWDLRFLEKCMTVFNKNEDIHAIYTKGQLINEKSERLNKFIEAKTIKDVSDVLAWKKGFVATPSCTILRSSARKNVGDWDTNLSTAADQDYFIRIAEKYPIEAIDEVLFFYRVHDQNMHQNIAVMERDHMLVFKKAKQKKLFKSFWFKQQCYSNLYWILAGSWWKEGQNKLRGFRFIILALLNNPFSIFRLLKTDPK